MGNRSGFLCVDVGNTCLKVTLLPPGDEMPGGGDAEVRRFDAADVEGVMEWIEEKYADGDVRECAMAAVGHVDPRLAESLRKEFGDEHFMLITPATEMPIKLEYATPKTLGLDRKSACCGAVAVAPGRKAMVIDAGSALTIDMVGSDGTFLGGNISPGLMMRFRALHEFTAGLPMIEAPAEEFLRIGKDTRGAIIAGAEGGWVDEVSAAIDRGVEDGVETVLLCGGDAPLLRRMLGNREIKIVEVPHLVAIGMRKIYRHHEK